MIHGNWTADAWRQPRSIQLPWEAVLLLDFAQFAGERKPLFVVLQYPLSPFRRRPAAGVDTINQSTSKPRSDLAPHFILLPDRTARKSGHQINSSSQMAMLA